MFMKTTIVDKSVQKEEQVKVFLSMPMHGLFERQVMEKRKELTRDIKEYFKYDPRKVIIIDNYHHPDAPKDAGRLWHLGRSIQQMAEADLIYFDNEWKDSMGCRIERKICKLYGIPFITWKDLARNVEILKNGERILNEVGIDPTTVKINRLEEGLVQYCSRIGITKMPKIMKTDPFVQELLSNKLDPQMIGRLLSSGIHDPDIPDYMKEELVNKLKTATKQEEKKEEEKEGDDPDDIAASTMDMICHHIQTLADEEIMDYCDSEDNKDVPVNNPEKLDSIKTEVKRLNAKNEYPSTKDQLSTAYGTMEANKGTDEIKKVSDVVPKAIREGFYGYSGKTPELSEEAVALMQEIINREVAKAIGDINKKEEKKDE